MDQHDDMVTPTEVGGTEQKELHHDMETTVRKYRWTAAS